MADPEPLRGDGFHIAPTTGRKAIDFLRIEEAMRKEECKVQSVPIVERKCVYNKQSKREFGVGSKTYDKKREESNQCSLL